MNEGMKYITRLKSIIHTSLEITKIIKRDMMAPIKTFLRDIDPHRDLLLISPSVISNAFPHIQIVATIA